MRSVLFIPPLARMSGGLANLYQLARDLRGLGHDVALVCPGDKAAGFSDVKEEGFAVLPWEGLRLFASDLWLVPESWPNALGAGLNQGAAAVVYAQSWNFLLTTLPPGVRWKQLPVRFIAVSRPVAWFMEQVLELKVEGFLPPTLHPAFSAVADARPANAVRVAWMPRKNKALAEQIRQVAEADLARQADAPPVSWTAVHNLAPRDVAEVFASCHIYLGTAFPEGFGLPPLEAMAAGCAPVGFTGFGGWDYMRQAAPSSHGPPFSLETAPGEGNGFYFADGDIMSAGLGLSAAVRMAADNTPDWRRMIRAGKTTASHYTREARLPLLAQLWTDLTGGP